MVKKRFLIFKIPILILIIVLTFDQFTNAQKYVITEDDIRNRANPVESHKWKTAELLMYFSAFKGRKVLFRDVYGENVRVIVTVPKEMRLSYSKYIRKRGFKIISGNDFKILGKRYPDLTCKEIIEKLNNRSKNIPLSVVLKIRIIDIKRKEYPGNHYNDYITVKAILIQLIL